MEATKKALLEAGRLAALSAIPLVIDGLSRGVIDWRYVGITVAIAVLRFADKFLHEMGARLGDESLKKGLTRF